MPWLPRVGFATLRNATVSAVNAGRADVSIDGGTATGLPVYGGSPNAGDKVLVAVQGDSMLVLGAGGQPTAGSARGGLSGTVPVSTATKLTMASHGLTGGLTFADNRVTLPGEGFYLVTAQALGFANPVAGSRAFLSIVLVGTPDSTLGRTNVGVGEDRISCTAMAYLPAGSQIQFDAYNNAGDSTIEAPSAYYIKYLGAT